MNKIVFIMDKELLEELLPYFENANDGTAQGNYLPELANDDVQGGICLHLVLTWMLLYKRANAIKAPNVIWHEMKTSSMIKQIANNQRAYQNFTGGQQAIYDSIKLLGLSCNTDVLFEKSNEIPFFANPTLGHTRMILICIYLYKGDKCVGGHAIGAIRHTANNSPERFYLFDPNVGVMQVPFGEKDELLNKIAYIYEAYRDYEIKGGYIFEIV